MLARRLIADAEGERCSPVDGRDSLSGHRHASQRRRHRAPPVRVGRQPPEVARLALWPRDR